MIRKSGHKTVGGPWSAVHFHGSMEEKVSEKGVLKQGWSSVRGSFPWKYGGEGVRKRGLKTGVVLGQGFISMEVWRRRCQKKGS